MATLEVVHQTLWGGKAIVLELPNASKVALQVEVRAAEMNEHHIEDLSEALAEKLPELAPEVMGCFYDGEGADLPPEIQRDRLTDLLEKQLEPIVHDIVHSGSDKLYAAVVATVFRSRWASADEA